MEEFKFLIKNILFLIRILYCIGHCHGHLRDKNFTHIMNIPEILQTKLKKFINFSKSLTNSIDFRLKHYIYACTDGHGST